MSLGDDDVYDEVGAVELEISKTHMREKKCQKTHGCFHTSRHNPPNQTKTHSPSISIGSIIKDMCLVRIRALAIPQSHLAVPPSSPQQAQAQL